MFPRAPLILLVVSGLSGSLLAGEAATADASRRLWEPSTLLQQMQSNLGEADACVLVVDSSPSMADTLQGLGRELDRVKGLLKEAGGDYMPLGLVTYADKPKVIQKPVKNHSKISAALTQIKVAASGKENPFAAVRFTLKEFAPKSERLVIFLVYDEAGEDQDTLEETIDLCRQKRAIVHLIGRDAAFGRSQWQWQEEHVGPPIRVDLMEGRLGPEMPSDRMLYDTHFLQRLWDPEGRGLEFCLSSGYSPWALSRLARETEGVYFPLKAGMSRVSFAMESERELKADYRPPLEALSEVQNYLASHPLGKITESTLEGASKITWPKLTFPGVKDAADLEFRLGRCLKEIALASASVDTLLEAHLKGRSAYREAHLRLRADWELSGASLMVIRFHLEHLKAQIEAWLGDPMALNNAGHVLIIPKVRHARTGSKRGDSGPDFLGMADPGVDITDRFLASLGQLASQACPDAASLRSRAEKALDLVAENHSGTPWAGMGRHIKDAMGDYELRSATPKKCKGPASEATLGQKAQ